MTVQKLDVYDKLYSSVSGDFIEYAVVLLQHPQILSSLVSAEYLYQQYVNNKEPNAKFDYSCISIMYYMALEDFLNKIVYIPYADNVLSKIDRNNIRSNEWQRKDALEYVSSFYSFWDKKKRVKRSCEISVLGYLLEAVQTESHFKEYLNNQFAGIDISRVELFGRALQKVAPRRNKAAHGGNYLSHADVCADKDNVYNTVETYKGMIIELLEICFQR